MRQLERAEQTALFNWAAWQSGKYPELKLMFAIPNGGSRNVIEAVNLKKSGVKAGVPDICLPVARGEYNCLWIEMKSENGKQSDPQRQWMYNLTQIGRGCYEICRSSEDAIKIIEEYLSCKL